MGRDSSYQKKNLLVIIIGCSLACILALAQSNFATLSGSVASAVPGGTGFPISWTSVTASRSISTATDQLRSKRRTATKARGDSETGEGRGGRHAAHGASHGD